MAITNKQTNVQFNYGGAQSTIGMISFDASAQAIYVGDGTNANLVSSSVKDATYVDNVLTITKIDGTQHVLNFNDVASAKQTMAVFTALETSINNLSTSVANLDASYKAADKAINDKIGGSFTADNTVAKAIEAAQNAAIAAGTIVAEDSDFITIDKTGETGKTQTYTIKTTNIASATDLLDVSIKANAAATKTELTTHTDNGDIHVTAEQKTNWQSATDAINAFLVDNAASNTALDTLKEIQDFLTSDDGTVETLLKDVAQNKQDISTNASNISDVSTRVSTLEGDTHTHDNKTLLDTYNQSNADLTDAVSKKHEHENKSVLDGITADKVSAWDAAEQNAKTYADKYASGINIKVGGTETHAESTINVAIEDLYDKVEAASEAGVQSLAVNTDSSKYAEVDNSTGAVSFKIKTVDVSTASTTSTGLADAYKTQQYVSFRVNNVIGTEGDASNANTVYGAKKYAEELNTAMDTRMNAVEAQLKWNVLA